MRQRLPARLPRRQRRHPSPQSRVRPARRLRSRQSMKLARPCKIPRRLRAVELMFPTLAAQSFASFLTARRMWFGVQLVLPRFRLPLACNRAPSSSVQPTRDESILLPMTVEIRYSCNLLKDRFRRFWSGTIRSMPLQATRVNFFVLVASVWVKDHMNRPFAMRSLPHRGGVFGGAERAMLICKPGPETVSDRMRPGVNGAQSTRVWRVLK